MELSLKFVGDGEDEGIVGGREEFVGAEKGASLGVEEFSDFAPDLWGDGWWVGHVCWVGGEERG